MDKGIDWSEEDLSWIIDIDRPQGEVDEKTRRRLASYYRSLQERIDRCERLCAFFKGDVRAYHYQSLIDLNKRLMTSIEYALGGAPSDDAEGGGMV